MKIIRILTMLCAFAFVAPVCAKQALRSANPQEALEAYLLVKKQEHERGLAYLASQQQMSGNIVLRGAKSPDQPVCPIVAQRMNAQMPMVDQRVAGNVPLQQQQQPNLVAQQQPQQIFVAPPQQPAQPQQTYSVQPDAVVQGVNNQDVLVQQGQGDNAPWIGKNSYWAQNVSTPINQKMPLIGLGAWAGSWTTLFGSFGCRSLHWCMGCCSQSLANGMVGNGITTVGTGLRTVADTVTLDRLSKAYLAWQIVDHRLSGRPLSETFKLWPTILPIVLGLAVNYTFSVGSPVHTAYTYCTYAKNAYDMYSLVNNMPQMLKEFEKLQAQAAAEQPDVEDTELVEPVHA